MPLRVTRHAIGRWLPFVVLVAVVVAITVISLSSSVTQWWDVQSTPATSSLPTAADPVLRARSDSANADVHVVLWFVAGLALVCAMRPDGWRRLAVAAGVLWAYSALLEIAQRWVPERTSQWIDVVGNGIGIAAGLAVGCAAVGISAHLRRRTAT
jgi:VanZ family protein